MNKRTKLVLGIFSVDMAIFLMLFVTILLGDYEATNKSAAMLFFKMAINAPQAPSYLGVLVGGRVLFAIGEIPAIMFFWKEK